MAEQWPSDRLHRTVGIRDPRGSLFYDFSAYREFPSLLLPKSNHLFVFLHLFLMSDN